MTIVHQHPGKPTKLTQTRQRIITDAVSVGLTWTVAAQYAGVALSSVMQWKRWGAESYEAILEALSTCSEAEWERIDALDDERTEDGSPTARDLALEQYLDPRKRPYFRLFRGIERAQAYFELRNLTLVQEAAAGYVDEETVTVTERNAEGEVVRATTTTRRRPQRAWQASAWLLERRFGERYAQTSRHEHAGIGGAPIQVEGPTPTEVLVSMNGNERDARTAEIIRIMAEADIIDAEVVRDVVVESGTHGNGAAGPASGNGHSPPDAVHPDRPDT